MNNSVFGDVDLINSSIDFKGNDNVFICKGKLKLKNCKIRFSGNNSLVFIDENLYPMSLNIRIGNDSVIYIGKDCYVNKTTNLYATERKNIIIGNQIMISFNTYFRTADPHLIYDANTKKRINFSKSILIGDRVWIGQEALILKGCVIGSGSIIGGRSVLANKCLKSNTLYAGNPARKIRDGVFFGEFRATHDYDLEEELKSGTFTLEDENQFIYEEDENTLSFKAIDMDLMNINNVNEKIKYIEENISKNNNKNRFYNN